MRRGSVTTYVDDGRRHSAGMVTPELRNNTRQEFTVNDIGYERPGGCFVSYRKIAFAFVFFLALVIAAAFIGVYIGSPPDKNVQDSLAILSEEEYVPNKYVLARSIKPQRYRVKLKPTPDPDETGRLVVNLEGRVAIDFVQLGDNGPNQLVLNSRLLTLKSCRLLVLDAEKNDSQPLAVGSVSEKSKRDAEEPTGETTTPAPITETTIPPSTSTDTAATEAKISTETTTLDEWPMIEEPGFTTELAIKGNKTDETGGVYVLFLDHKLRNGNYSLVIEYETILDERVLFVTNYTRNNEERLLLVSKLKPVNAPRLFPTLGEAKLKASFALTLLHPRETRVLSNTLSMNSSDASTNTTVDVFAETRSISADNLAFVIGTGLESLGEIATSEQTPLRIVYWGGVERRSQEFYLRDKIGSVATAYADFFSGVNRSSEKLDLVAAPVDFDGLSAPGLIVVRESLFYTPPSSPVLVKERALLNLIGLVGQQWLGGLVDAKNWTDAWFIEGSIIYLQYALIDKIDHSLEASDNFLVDVQLEAMENDGYAISKALSANVDRNRIEAFDLADNYKKGACLISMLHAAVNESAFRNGYSDFLQRWSYGSADSDEFLHILAGHVSLPGEPSAKLNEALASWTRQPGYPVVNVTWNRENGSVIVKQGKFNFYESTDEDDSEQDSSSSSSSSSNGASQLWWVPLTYVTEEGNWSEPSSVWLRGKEEMSLENVGRPGNDTWLVFNVNRTGYYRVNYDGANWRSLSAALRERHQDIPVATRASLVDDALSLARQGSLDYEIALDLLLYMGPSERSYAPWRALAWHAMQLDFALYETPAYPSFQECMRKFIATLYDEMEPKIDQGTPLVMLAVQLACTFEHQKCTSWAKTKWEDIFKNNKENTWMKHVRETIYCIGAQRGGQEELSYLMKKFEETSDQDEKDRLLSALGCFQSPWILQKILNEILETNRYEESDIKVILLSYAKNPAAAQAARRFVQENWKEIVKRFSKSYWTMRAFVMASTSLLFNQHDLNEFNAFRDEHIDSLKAMGHWVALNEMKAFSWVARLKKSAGSIQRWLRNHTIST